MPPLRPRPPKQIDWAMDALLALAVDLSIAHQSIEPRAGLAIVGSVDQPRDRCAGKPRPGRHLLDNLGLDLAREHALRSVAGALGQFAQERQYGSSGLWDLRAHETSVQANRSPVGSWFSGSGLDAGGAYGRVAAAMAVLATSGAGFHSRHLMWATVCTIQTVSNCDAPSEDGSGLTSFWL